MSTQTKIGVETPSAKKNIKVANKQGTLITKPRLNTGVIVAREKTKYMNLMANSNILANPKDPFIIYITRIGPEKLVENRAAWVEFDVWHRGAGAEFTDLFVRVTVQARQSVDDVAGYFIFPIKSISPGQSIDGAISFLLPRADVGNTVTVELCQYGELLGEFRSVNVLASDQSEFAVAARFTIGMNNIYISDTASHHEDTVVVGFHGQTNEKSWDDVSHLGDHNNTGPEGILPEVLPVGPFDMIPGSGSNVVVSCVIANAGHTSTEEDAKNALTIVSKVGEVTAATVLSIIFPFGAAAWTLLAEATNELNLAIINYALADCDTIVLRDIRFILEQELFGLTNDPDDIKSVDYPAEWIMHSHKRIGKLPKLTPDEPDLPLGGGCRDSDYTTGLYVVRHRSPEVSHNFDMDTIHLMPGQEARFGPAMGNIMYTHEGNGRLDTHGVYKAPLTASDRKFEIIRWTVLQENKNGIFPAFEDFNIVLLD